MTIHKRLVNSLILCQLLADELELMNVKGQDKQKVNNMVAWLTTTTDKFFMTFSEENKEALNKEFHNCMEVIRGILHEVEENEYESRRYSL